MIICEGPDGGGKSTLVRKLHEELGIKLSPEARLSKEARNDPSFRTPAAVRSRIYKALVREVVGRKPPVLYDRLYFSELIYSPAYGRELAYNWHEQLHIGRTLNALKVPVIFCVPPYEEVMKHFLVGNQMDDLQGKMAEIYNTYTAMGDMFMSRKREFKPMKGKHGENYSRTPRDYALPQVTWYDYTKPKSYEEVKTVVLKYLTTRAMRCQGWIGSQPNKK